MQWQVLFQKLEHMYRVAYNNVNQRPDATADETKQDEDQFRDDGFMVYDDVEEKKSPVRNQSVSSSETVDEETNRVLTSGAAPRPMLPCEEEISGMEDVIE